MSRRDALIREAAAEIDRINKLVGGAAVPFGVEDTLAVVKLLLAEQGQLPTRRGIPRDDTEYEQDLSKAVAAVAPPDRPRRRNI